MTRTVMAPALHPGQETVARSTARFRVLACGRRWGKTALSSLLAVKEAADIERVGWFAPSHKQTMEGWRYMRSLVGDLPGVKMLESEREIHFPGGGFVECRTTDDPDRLRGGGWGLAILDECQYMDARVWPEIIRPALMDRSGRALFISTPCGQDWFYKLYRMGADGVPGWAAWQFPSHDNPAISRAELEQASLGITDRAYQQEILAQFLPDGGGVLRNVRACSIRAPEMGHAGRRYITFWDTALGTSDFNAVSVFRKEGQTLIQVYADRWGELPYTIIQSRISGLRQYPGMLYVDITGTNVHRHASVQATAGLVGPSVSVRGYTFDNARKEEMTDNMALRLETGGVELLDPDQCTGDMRSAVVAQVDELEAWSSRKLPSGLTRYAGPEGTHDDMAVATMAAALLAKEGLGVDVAQVFRDIGTW